MRKNFGAKPFMYPLPVLIVAAYDENGIPNAMNAAWGTIADFHQVAIYLAKEHKTTENILKTNEETECKIIAKDLNFIITGISAKIQISDNIDIISSKYK